MIYLLVFILGLLIGSFLNVIGLRWNSGLTLGGRSFCSTCGRRLSALELWPVLSFVALGGRCRSCRAKISWQYPLVEVFTGIVFLTIFIYWQRFFELWSSAFLVSVFLYLAVFAIYIVIAIYDSKHKIIPDELVYSAIILALLYRLMAGGLVLDWVIGPAIFVFFASFWLLSKGRLMGFGDAKLGLSIGLLLGFAEGLSATVFAFWTGALFGIFIGLASLVYPLFKLGKKFTIKSEIPFAPFMVLGAWLALIFTLPGLDVLL